MASRTTVHCSSEGTCSGVPTGALKRAAARIRSDADIVHRFGNARTGGATARAVSGGRPLVTTPECRVGEVRAADVGKVRSLLNGAAVGPASAIRRRTARGPGVPTGGGMGRGIVDFAVRCPAYRLDIRIIQYKFQTNSCRG